MADGEVHGLSAELGELRADVRNLTQVVHEGRAEIRDLSGDMRSLEHTVSDMKPQVEAYRSERDQRAGAAIWRDRVMKILIMTGTGIGSSATALQALRWLWAKG